MAGIIRKTLKQIRAGRPSVDRTRLAATTEADIKRQIAEDPDTAPDVTELGPPLRRPLPEVAPQRLKAMRAKLKLSQAAFANSLHVPVKTYQNWEQGRTTPDPVARTLLYLLEKDPERILKLLAEAA